MKLTKDMRGIDTNVLLRYLIGDYPDLQQESAGLIERIKNGEEEAMTTPVVIHELCYVMTASPPNGYGLTNVEAKNRIYAIIELDGIRIHDKTVCLDALTIFSEREYLDYCDALGIAYVRNGSCEGLYSYDRKLDNIEGANRLRP